MDTGGRFIVFCFRVAAGDIKTTPGSRGSVFNASPREYINIASIL